MNAKNQGRRILVVLAGLGFLVLVGLLAPPAQIVTLKSAKIAVVGVKKIATRVLLPHPPQTVNLITEDFENGLSWTPTPLPCSFCPGWVLLNAFQCMNQASTNVASFTRKATCGWTAPGAFINQKLSSPTFSCPAAPTWSTSSVFTVSLDARKLVAGAVSTNLWISDGIGANAITVFPDNTGNLVHLDLAVPNASWYLQPSLTNHFEAQVVNPTAGFGNEFDIDNFNAKIVFSANNNCSQIVVQIMKDDSNLTPEGVCTLVFPPGSGTTRTVIFDTQAYLPNASAPTFPANTVLGSNFSSSCQALNPTAPTVFEPMFVMPEQLTLEIPLPEAPANAPSGNYVHFAQVYDDATGELSPIIMIPVAGH